jgi:uncharacterized protein YyaL (SSP411 family)
MNRLGKETSPYLLQHAENPVDWYPWGDEALERARTEDKPILLSIGYSACHWCHVMAHESFEDAATAAEMNAGFVNIKVDREERPDVDQIYQQALQLQGEGGGWPLTMFLLPDGRPFFGGTYFPPRDNYGRPSFRRVLGALSEAWQNRRGEVTEQADEYRRGLASLAKRGRELGAEAKFAADTVERAALKLGSRMDPREGGFGGAPKFPNPKSVELVLRGGVALADEHGAELLSRVKLALVKMAEGGIYDQIGGGFARYSTDAVWLVPHFEKMLYDNGQLLTLYAEGHQVFGDPLFARVIRETAAYLERDMRHASGGLYTAEDADSEGVEGKFYVWTPAEVRAVLPAELVEVALRCLGVVEGGNWRDPHGHGPEGASILHVAARPADAAEQAKLDEAKRLLLAARSKRVRPGLDDKSLASSNGLALAGLAEAGRILGDSALVDGALRTADFLLREMRGADGRMRRSWKNGEARLPGTLDDHALVADGLIALYEANGDGKWLEEAHRLTALCLDLFYDAAEGCLYMTAASDGELLLRPISSWDHAVPSGMSVCVENLVRLGDVCGERRFSEAAERLLATYHAEAVQQPFGFANLLSALDMWLLRPSEIVLAGDDGSLGSALAQKYLRSRVILRAESAPKIVAPLVDGKVPVGGKPTAYVCRDFTCQSPITDPAQL